jgi:Ca2+-binding EF-hand superfamily protein
MISADIHLSKEEIQKMFEDLDYDKSEKLNYREFLAATVDF